MTKHIVFIQGPETEAETQLAAAKEQFHTDGEIIFSGIENDHAIAKKYFESLNGVVFHLLGDGKRNINIDEINTFLQGVGNKIACDATDRPLVIVTAHGTAANVINSDIRPHFLSCAEGEYLYTGELFYNINHNLRGPVDLILVSCMAGPAHIATHLLPLGSKLVTFTNTTAKIRATAIKDIFTVLENCALSTADDFTTSMLEAYLLKRGLNEEEKGSIGLSYSGSSGVEDFSKYYDSHLGKPISLEKLQRVYKEFQKFHYISKVTSLLNSPDLSIETVIKEVNQYVAKVLRYKKLNTPIADTPPTKEELTNLVEEMDQYSRIDEAVAAILSGDMENVNWEYCHGFWNEHGVQFDTRKVIPEILATLFFLYSSSMETKELDNLSQLSSEIRLLQDKFKAKPADNIVFNGDHLLELLSSAHPVLVAKENDKVEQTFWDFAYHMFDIN